MRFTIILLTVSLCTIAASCYSQYVRVVKNKSPLYSTPRFGGHRVGEVMPGDTVLVSYLDWQWAFFNGTDGKKKYLYASNLVAVNRDAATQPSEVRSVVAVSNVSWSFMYLLRLTGYVFLVVIACVAIGLFIIHYIF